MTYGLIGVLVQGIFRLPDGSAGLHFPLTRTTLRTNLIRGFKHIDRKGKLMQSMNDFYWARDAVDDVTGKKTKKEKETMACERRLKQMERNRQRQIAKEKDRENSN